MLKERAFGILFAIAGSIGGSIAMGVLFMPQRVAAQLPDLTWFWALWIAGGVFSFLGAFPMAELSVTYPRSGGYYVYAQKGFGDFVGFLTGYFDWMVICAANVLISIVLVRSAGVYFPALITYEPFAVMTFLLVILAIQLPGSRWTELSQIILTVPKILMFIGVVVVCFTASPHPDYVAPPRPDLPFPTGIALFAAVIVAMQGIWPTYGGWEIPIYAGGEIRNPEKTIPRALVFGVLGCTLIYVTMISGVLNVLTIHEVGAAEGPVPFSVSPFTVAAEKLFGPSGGYVIAVVTVVILASAVNSCTNNGARVVHALSTDRLFPRQGAHVWQNGTPIGGLLIGFLVQVVMLWTGSFMTLLSVLALFQFMNYAIVFGAVFVLRKRDPHTPRPYKAWLHPWSTGIVTAVSVAFVIGAIGTDFVNSMIALGIGVVAYPVYRIAKYQFRNNPVS